LPGDSALFHGMNFGANRPRKKADFEQNRERQASGAEARFDFACVIPGINPRPTARTSFWAACKGKARVDVGCVIPGDKSPAPTRPNEFSAAVKLQGADAMMASAPFVWP